MPSVLRVRYTPSDDGTEGPDLTTQKVELPDMELHPAGGAENERPLFRLVHPTDPACTYKLVAAVRLRHDKHEPDLIRLFDLETPSGPQVQSHASVPSAQGDPEWRVGGVGHQHDLFFMRIDEP
jgi:hypothetical protein